MVVVWVLESPSRVKELIYLLDAFVGSTMIPPIADRFIAGESINEAIEHA
jgi:hypothetical protein